MYNYQENMKADIREAIARDCDLEVYRGRRDDLEEELNDKLWLDDNVTGNGSGSYTFNSIEAKEYVIDNLDLLAEMATEYGLDDKTIAEHFLSEDWEYFDVSIRCYLLGQVTHEVLDEMEAAGVFNEIDYDYGYRKTDREKEYEMSY